ncbi:MAG: HEPN domain-containing protein [Acidimicrobiales bacterium]
MAYLAKAAEFLRAAQDSYELGNGTAATGNAVHAGIAASGALSAALAGSVSQGDHGDAPSHLDAIGGDGKIAARQLRQLLPLKTQAEYDPRPISMADARRAVGAAARLVALAERVIAKAGGGR